MNERRTGIADLSLVKTTVKRLVWNGIKYAARSDSGVVTAVGSPMWTGVRFAARRFHSVLAYIGRLLVTPKVILLLKGFEVSQRLDLRDGNIKGIALLFATFQRSNDCTVEIVLHERTGRVLYRETVAGRNLGDNEHYWLNLEDVQELDPKAGIWLTVRSDGVPGNHVALWRAFGGRHHFWLRCSTDDFAVPPDEASVGLPFPGSQLSLLLQHDDRSFCYRRDEPKQEVLVAVPRRVALLATDGSRGADYWQNRLQPSDRLDIVTIPLVELTNERLNQAGADLLLLPAKAEVGAARTAALLARNFGIPVALVALDVAVPEPRQIKAWPFFADFLLSDQTAQCELFSPSLHIADVPVAHAVEQVLGAYRQRRLPKISLVTILHAKGDQIGAVFESYFSQTYAGEFEIIFVDDASPAAESERIADLFAELQERLQPVTRISHRIIRNDRNLGNCISRNRGVDAATGDIIVIIDADCMLNRDYLKAHADAHSYLDCDVVIGPHNIETNDAPPLQFLDELERCPERALALSELQDPINLHSFLNCITRNFSIKRVAVDGPLFDPAFSYSRDPATGFGWEDVEMGYRLYQRGLRIKFTTDAFSVHISHPSGISDAEKLRRSFKNFRKLFDKHPELGLAARRWASGKFQLLLDWEQRLAMETIELPDRRAVDKHFKSINGKTFFIGTQRRLRVLTYRWHVPHQYELYKLPHEFFLVTGLGTPMGNWEYGQRPKPANANFIAAAEVDPRDFDVAILHFDENVLSYENTNGKIGADWGASFRWFVENVDLPKVAVCHGTPQFHGQYTPGYNKPDLMQVIEKARTRLVEYVRDIEVVCNSHQAHGEWNFHRSRVIWHGFDPTEFQQTTYRGGILSPLGPLVTSRPHYRGFYLYQQVFDESYPREFLPSQLAVPEPDIDYVDNIYAIGKYRNYVDQLRGYSVYFNPTLRSPMPRARGEPMMCGLVTVNANNHDVEMFIKNGVNGFYANEAGELREQLLYLMRNPEATRKIGAEARRTAMDVFNHDRYLASWSNLLASVT
ncbi:glycosyltransferase [Roseibium sediminis]|uniref:glycosyltransferase n=1 Tax=Roseibium sediminis TaxID=1775174 RepID=UPI001375A1B1|nr:glycosyltransferase [Roseibium sediminis]